MAKTQVSRAMQCLPLSDKCSAGVVPNRLSAVSSMSHASEPEMPRPVMATKAMISRSKASMMR